MQNKRMLLSATPTQQLVTESVRVTRWDFPPSTETGVHQHEYDYVVVPVISGVLSITSPSGDVAEVPIRVGESYMRLAGVEHNVANHTADPVAFVEIELLEHPLV